MIEYNHTVLGNIFLNPTARARRLSLRMRANGEVCLSYPPTITSREALAFLEEKMPWVLRTRERLQQQHKAPLVLDATFATRHHILRLFPSATQRLSCQITDHEIQVSYPATLRYDTPQVQEFLRHVVEETWRIEAQQDLPPRVRQLCRTFGFRCGEVTIRNTRTRWGSCSADDNLSLSLHLMKLPDELTDYILLHELCHTRHKNHGPAFYALLNQVTSGRHPQLLKALKAYTTRW